MAWNGFGVSAYTAWSLLLILLRWAMPDASGSGTSNDKTPRFSFTLIYYRHYGVIGCESDRPVVEIIDNINKTLKDDMVITLRSGSKVSIAASCFSIYAFQELKEQLSDISELRFIFTSPSFITEKADKQKREFYIPRLNRERDLSVRNLKSNSAMSFR